MKISDKKSAAPQQPSSGEMAMTAKGLRFLLAGLVVIVAGFILMMGGGSKDPQVFNYAMFNFQRLYLAPTVIIVGIVMEILAIMGRFDRKDSKEGRE